jgi:DNA-directed RNA polymerase subunit F
MARKKSKANYFTSETEAYINKYNSSTDIEYRNTIFTNHIYFPFYKLAENIIHTFKFYYTDVEQIEDLKHEIVSMLLEEKIMKFDPTNGAKAYSYFGTIVKRWLINYNNKNYKNLKKVGTFDEMYDGNETSISIEEENAISLGQFLDLYVEDMYEVLEDLFPKDNERKIADAILTIFKTRQDLDFFKKKALYIYIREMTDCETPHLTKVVNKLKEEFYTSYQEYNTQGLIRTKSL